MTLQVYNTLSGRKEEFVPLNPPKVAMYVCGVTVYDECHLGHARALVNSDVICRYLKFRGFDVTFARNFTDVEDKIINRANKEGVSWEEIATRYIATFNRDVQALGCVSPTFEPKATENMDQILGVIAKLVDKGFAYKAGDDVFFSVRKKSDYGKLSGKKIDELEAGARIEIHEKKRDPLDFALWKGAKPGEPSWDSSWGPGRPGWHIECSAMSMNLLGETFDIHGGGRDLSFPHHENEIAQSEAATGKLFARYWLHNGFVNINAEKMSKSLKNFMTIHEILKKYNSQVVRFFILGAHYRSPLEYTEQNMEQARQTLDRWYTTLARVKQCASNSTDPKSGDVTGLHARVDHLMEEFCSAMDDDFNTARVMGILFDLVRDFNKLLDGPSKISGGLCEKFAGCAQKIHGILGVFGADPDEYLDDERKRGISKGPLSPDDIELKISARNEARNQKNWALADSIRKELADAGVQLKDSPDGSTTWSAS